MKKSETSVKYLSIEPRYTPDNNLIKKYALLNKKHYNNHYYTVSNPKKKCKKIIPRNKSHF